MTRYFIRIKGTGATIAEAGYSKFFKRLAAKSNGKLKGRVYGPLQAGEHISELRKHVYDGKKPYALTAFEIVKSVTTETVL